MLQIRSKESQEIPFYVLLSQAKRATEGEQNDSLSCLSCLQLEGSKREVSEREQRQ